jgi:hypothetical protein
LLSASIIDAAFRPRKSAWVSAFQSGARACGTCRSDCAANAHSRPKNLLYIADPAAYRCRVAPQHLVLNGAKSAKTLGIVASGAVMRRGASKAAA